MGDVSGCMTFVWEERTEKGKETPSRKTLFPSFDTLSAPNRGTVPGGSVGRWAAPSLAEPTDAGASDC